MADPQQGVAYTFTISLLDASNPGRIKTTPTIAAGDFKCKTDSGSFTNLATLPTETPAASGIVLVSLSAGEMGSSGPGTGSKVTVVWSDPQLQWTDGMQFIDAPVHTAHSAMTTILASLTTGTALSTAERNAIADALLDRNMGTGTDSGSTTIRTPRQALRRQRNRVAISGTTMTVYKENDTTADHTAVLTGAAGADPIIEINPAG